MPTEHNVSAMMVITMTLDLHAVLKDNNLNAHQDQTGTMIRKYANAQLLENIWLVLNADHAEIMKDGMETNVFV